MPQRRLRLRVEGADGRQQVLDVDTADQAVALRHASSRGWRVLSIETNSEGRMPAAVDSGGRFPLILFNHELLALLDAGLNLTEALTTLLAKERAPAASALLSRTLQLLREGRSFSDVLEMWPEQFPGVYVATVRASERSGGLPEALRRYLDYQLQFEAIRKKVAAAAIYPVLLLIAGGFVTLFLLGYVVPRFSTIYESSGRSMPWLSSVLLSFGKVIYQDWQIALTTLVGAFVALGLAISRPGGRAWLLDRVLRLPGLAAKSDEFRLTRFYRAVSLLLTAGIPLPRALGMVTGLLSAPQRVRLSQARLAVEQGRSLSSALVAAGLANAVAESLLRVGERSGKLAEMLERTARFQDEDFGRWVEWFSRLLEPTLMAIIGLVIGAVVVLMYVPIFDLAGSLQ